MSFSSNASISSDVAEVQQRGMQCGGAKNIKLYDFRLKVSERPVSLARSVGVASYQCHAPSISIESFKLALDDRLEAFVGAHRSGAKDEL